MKLPSRPSGLRAAAVGISLLCMGAPPILARPSPVQVESAVASSTHSRSTKGFEHLLPANTRIFVGTSDLGAVLRDLADGPWGQVWADPACAALRGEVTAHISSLRRAASLHQVDLAAAGRELDGGFAVAVLFESSDRVARGDDPQEPRASLMLISGLAEEHDALQQAVDQLLRQFVEGDEHRVSRTETIGRWVLTEVQGGDKYRRPLAVRSILTSDTMIVELAINGADATRDVLDAMDRNGDVAALADDPRFRDSVAARAGGVQFWVDAKATSGWLRSGFEAMESVGVPELAVPLGLLRRSGLLDIQEVAASSTADAGGSRFELRAQWPAGGWLREALERLCVPGELNVNRDCPADALSVTSVRIDFTGLFDLGLKELIATGTVKLPEAVDWLASFESETGFTLRDEVLASLDGQFTVATCRGDPTETPGSSSDDTSSTVVVLLGLEDGAAFGAFVEGFVRSRALAATRERAEIEGFELFTVTVFPGLEISYAVLPRALVASLSPTPVTEVLRRTAGADLPRYAEREDVGPLVDRLSRKRGLLAVSRASLHTSTVVLGLVSFLGPAVGTVLVASEAGPGPDRLSQLYDLLTAFPEPDVFERHFKGLVATAVSVDPGGITLEVVAP